MLRADGISFGHGGGPLLFRQLDVTIHPGERLGLCGSSGTGKSTLAMVLSGHLRPITGAVTADGQDLSSFRGRPRPVQYAAQAAELAIDPLWTVDTILANGAVPERSVLDALGIAPAWRDRRPHMLSGGELQRVALARLLVPATRYLICDEVTAQLDALAQATLWDGLFSIADARDLGVMIISHDRDLLLAHCDRVLDMASLATADRR